MSTEMGFIVLFASCLVLGIAGNAVAADEDWQDVKAAYEEVFVPLPVGRMFSDPDRELKLSRRAPYTAAARAEIDKARAQARLKRAQIVNERAKRYDVVGRIGAFGGPHAARLLMKIYEDQLSEIDTAEKNADRFAEAARIDINPGVDPGGVYWQRWLRKERGAAGAALVAERKVRDLALEQCAKLHSPEIREWLLRNAGSHERPEVREQMVAVLAASGDPQDTVALGELLREEKEVWARVLILDTLAKEKNPCAAVYILGALSDEAWPVRSVAVAGTRALGLRDAAAIDVLLSSMEQSEGRVRQEIRNALCEATGEAFGSSPDEWKLWWNTKREDWAPPAGPFDVAPPDVELPRLFGVPTASRRIAIVINRGSLMRKPVKRRALGNDGEPSPAPAVDNALRIATWELEEGLATLSADVEFVVIVYGKKLHVSTKRLKRATKDARKKAVAVAARFEPDGRATLAPAREAVLRLGIPKKVDDLALGGEGDVDTIFLVGGGTVSPRIRRLRRVAVHSIDLGRLAKLAALKSK